MSEMMMFQLPEGAYFDADGFLCRPNGMLMPDGIYIDSEGEMFMYQNDFTRFATWSDEDIRHWADQLEPPMPEE
ncbi:MAG: hypothetical protein IKE61_04125 [Coriobacteriales bacterium]|nr:hypothetical protein [Coriobacteriales bacterium]